MSGQSLESASAGISPVQFLSLSAISLFSFPLTKNTNPTQSDTAGVGVILQTMKVLFLELGDRSEQQAISRFSFPRAPESHVAYHWARWILPQIADFINLEGAGSKRAWLHYPGSFDNITRYPTKNCSSSLHTCPNSSSN
jgi:hypothetical protein